MERAGEQVLLHDHVLIRHPIMPGDVDLSSILLAPRFGVDQGIRSDGSRKIRAVDDCTRSGVNGATQPSVKLNIDGNRVDFSPM